MTEAQAIHIAKYLDKTANGEGGGFTGIAQDIVSKLFEHGQTLALFLPPLAGAGAGYLASKFTSPAGNEKLIQDEIIKAESDEAVATLKRKQELAKKSANAKAKANDRSLHI